MNEEKINNSPKKLRILVAPLDWGLGHATRCIPIIHTLLKLNSDVYLAAKAPIKNLYEAEFPGVKILELEGYNITYARHQKFFILKLITQLPKLMVSIRKERRWLTKVIREERIDAVISDNRPGLNHPTVPCIYITHQLQIQSRNQLLQLWLRKLHYAFINRFDQCWIPDHASGQTLAGALSHPTVYPDITYKHIGLLSRFEKKQLPIIYDFLLLISGPEPQRSILEEKLLQAFDKSIYSFALVRGLPSKNALPLTATSASAVFDHLNANDLNDLILQSKMVVARAGYSTIMDLAKLQKQAVLIATPGQTEQEYLAQYLNEEKIFAGIRQKNISLSNIEKAAAKAGFSVPEYNATAHEKVIRDWVASLAQMGPAI